MYSCFKNEGSPLLAQNEVRADIFDGLFGSLPFRSDSNRFMPVIVSPIQFGSDIFKQAPPVKK